MTEWKDITQCKPNMSVLLWFEDTGSMCVGYPTDDGRWSMPWAFTCLPSKFPTAWSDLPLPPLPHNGIEP